MSDTLAPTVHRGSHSYRASIGRRLLILLGLAAALVVSFAVDLATGPYDYPLSDVVTTLLFPDDADTKMRVILWEIRMPVALMALTVGASLSVAGAQMQTILANPLASPFTLGISAAAGFGAALALVFGIALVPVLTAFIIPLNAFVMAMLAALVIHFFSQLRGVTVETIVLLGIAMVFTFNALQALLQYLASEQALSAVVFWTMGSLVKATWTKVAVTAMALVLTVPLFIRQSWALTALRLGDARAESLGVNVKRLRLTTLMLVSLLAAISVSFVGSIGFIGLVGPHIARMLVGEDQRFFMPASILCGALILSATSVLSKMLVPGAILPIGVATALVGIPFFFSLIFASRKRNAW
ncbi:FecCD family ABC transporter permease [Larsenimonas rhizosphaerae]|uniref:Iron ABC transporter permease n=1 Tax=Larsenimonas rhizosphaerae TaxID=2944682 RepID=A0AA42CXP5_9GAMM|nr:iron ABC transporter permease [Larsenimonas rhizosphaerae]MCM2129437.1 iron ABC transporter permease [Larsenimonas rhizosphaerae]MCX2524093.1 iron ABC transporter permease [Larsenimonas rhizosphaerae]